MKNQTIRNRYAGLVMLSQRVLPTKGINKVATLIATRFQRPYDATELARKNIIAQYPLPDGWDKDHLPPAVAEARQKAMDALMEESTPVKKVPDHLRLRSSDLPHVLRREGGESNVEGLAEILVFLGSLYVPDESDAAEDAADTGGEEEEE